MRLAAVLALAAALVALFPAEARATSCAPTLTWRGVLYSGGLRPRGVEVGSRVGTGFVPDCPGPDEDAEPPTPVALLRVVGVRAAIAVVARHDRDVYLAEGFVIESPLHPSTGRSSAAEARTRRAAGRAEPCSGARVA